MISSASAGAPATQPSGLGENILPNPSFEWTEPAPLPVGRITEAVPQHPPKDQPIPRTWEVWLTGPAESFLPDDPAQARTGRRAVHLKAPAGMAMIRYSDVPIFDKQPWTIKVFARGKGRLVISAGRWDYLLGQTQADMTDQWKEYTLTFTPPQGREVFSVDITHSGPGDFYLDDASLSHPAIKPLNIVPSKPVGKDEHTLLYLPCEELKRDRKLGTIDLVTLDGVELLGTGRFDLLKDGQGRFGKGMALEPGSTLLTSAGEHLNGKVGTIEMWVKLRAVRQDSISDCFVGVIGGDGMYFGKFIFGQITFGFSTSFARQCGFECWPNQVTNWAPGTWRHFVAVWDQDAMEVFIDGKLAGYQAKPNLTKYPGDCLSIGGSNWGVDLGSFDFDDLRISDIVRYRFPLPAPKPQAK